MQPPGLYLLRQAHYLRHAERTQGTTRGDTRKDATIFGDALHVLAEEGTKNRLQQDLVAGDFGESAVHPIPATLEDVFVTLTRQRALERGHV